MNSYSKSILIIVCFLKESVCGIITIKNLSITFSIINIRYFFHSYFFCSRLVMARNTFYKQRVSIIFYCFLHIVVWDDTKLLWRTCYLIYFRKRPNKLICVQLEEKNYRIVLSPWTSLNYYIRVLFVLLAFLINIFRLLSMLQQFERNKKGTNVLDIVL